MLELVYQWVKDNAKRQEGQTMAEYGLILALIAVVVIGTLVALGGTIKSKLTDVNSGFTRTTTTP